MEAVLDVFRGQPFITSAAAARGADGVVSNRIDLQDATILENLRDVQRRGGLEPSSSLHRLGGDDDGPGFFNVAIEMETGTGKTYVYLRTALELARRHGLRKYVIVVPSVAVREGVLATLRATAEHFRSLYPDVVYRFYAYDGRRLDRLRGFARSGDVELMVMTLDAFNRDGNVIRRPTDGLHGRSPLTLLRACRSVLILDEPQNMESDLSIRSLAMLDPLFALRWSATHRHSYGLVHRLTPRAAHRAGLVKRIQVATIEGGASRASAIHARIHQTVALHLRRQRELRSQGVKVLSLFFIERVADYVAEEGLARLAFDDCFRSLRHLDPVVEKTTPEIVRAAYFAHHRRRSGDCDAIDSSSGRSVEDERAYALIMRDKERLLSLDEPVGFVFSHSALREGWDNPNVFFICSLAPPSTTVRRRQEVGRGLRLAVDRHGCRVSDPEVNVLTIVTSERHGEFVAGLQAELADESFEPTEQPEVTALVERNNRRSASRPPSSLPVRLEPLTIDVGRLVAEAIENLTDRGPPKHVASGPLPDVVGLASELLRRCSPPLLVPRHVLLPIVAAVDPERLLSAPILVAHDVAQAVAVTVRKWEARRTAR